MEGDDGKVHFAKKRKTLVPNDRGVRKFEHPRSKQQADFRPGRRQVERPEYSATQGLSQKKVVAPPRAEEKQARPLKRYFPEKSGFDYAEDVSFRPMRKVDFTKQGTLENNPSQVSMEKSFGRKGRVPQQPTEEPTGHKAAVYKPGYFKQENKYLPSSMIEANATLTATQRRLRKTQQQKEQALSRDTRAVFELTNNVSEGGQVVDSWERRTGLYVWKSKSEK